MSGGPAGDGKAGGNDLDLSLLLWMSKVITIFVCCSHSWGRRCFWQIGSRPWRRILLQEGKLFSNILHTIFCLCFVISHVDITLILCNYSSNKSSSRNWKPIKSRKPIIIKSKSTSMKKPWNVTRKLFQKSPNKWKHCQRCFFPFFVEEFPYAFFAWSFQCFT